MINKVTQGDAMELTTELNKMLSFLKEAFCIDGEIVKHKEFTIDKMPSVMFKLTDTQRGEFYVTLSTDKK